MTVGITQSAATIFAPTQSNGAARRPSLADAQRWGVEVERIIDATYGTTAVFGTLAAANSNLNWPADTLGRVVSDGANNGIYRKIGASGSGSWVYVASLDNTDINVQTAIDAATTATAAANTAVDAVNSLSVVTSVVATITALKSVDTTSRTFAIVSEIGRGGLFVWRAGDFSARIAADTQEGVWVKANAIASSAGAWERVFTGPLRAEWFGVFPRGLVTSTVTDVTTALNNLSQFAKTYFSHVTFLAGHYYAQNWTIPRGVLFEGLGMTPNTRNGPTDTQFDALVTADSAAVFIAMGDTPLTVQVDFCSENIQVGYHRTIGSGDQNPDAASPFSTIRLFDGTNRDASGATRATLKDNKVFAFVEDGWDRFFLRNIKMIPSCPGASETYGLGGYIDYSVARTPANYDFGLFYRNGWEARIDECAIVGYWRQAAVFNYLPPAAGFTTATPNNEQGLITNTSIQSGFMMRSGDLFPIAAKVGNNLYVRWTQSHRFATSGTVRITTSDTLAGGNDESYTMTFTTTNPPGKTAANGWLVFAIADASAYTAGAAHIVTIPGQGGSSHTILRDCYITDLAHHTGVQNDADEIAAWAGRFRAAIEISGAPMRAVSFDRCVFNVVGPVAAHIGCARDLVFQGESYSERRPFRYSLGGALQTSRGGVFIVGSDSSSSTTLWIEAGQAGGVQIKFFQAGPLNDTINVAPYAPARSGVPFETVTWFYPREVDMRPWTQTVGARGGIAIGTATAAQLANSIDICNTVGKAQGVIMWETTNNRLYVARAGSATSVWQEIGGSNNITPS